MSWGSWSLSLPGVLKQLGAGISRENIFFPQEHIPSAPCSGSVPWSCPMGCTESTGSPIPSLSAFPAMSQPASKLPFVALGPQISSWHFQSSLFPSDICFKWCLHHPAEHLSL